MSLISTAGETPHISSEDLEPNFARLIGAWWSAVEANGRSVDALIWFRERVLALSALASEARAIHAVIVLQTDLSMIEGAIRKQGYEIGHGFGTMAVYKLNKER